MRNQRQKNEKLVIEEDRMQNQKQKKIEIAIEKNLTRNNKIAIEENK